MSIRRVIPNSWTVVVADATARLTYAPQVYPSPLRVSQQGAVQVVVTNQNSSDVVVEFIKFTIPVGPGQDTLTAGAIRSRVNNSAWSVAQLESELETGTARFILGPASNNSVTLAAGAAIVVEFYGFTTHDHAGTTTVTIAEHTGATGGASFTVTTFPWEFTFSGLTANVQAGSLLQPVAQVEHGSSVTLTWQCSVTELTAYEIYCSARDGQSGPFTPTLIGQWRSPKLMTDTVFILVIKPAGLIASLSTAVAVRNADVQVGTLSVNENMLLADDGGVGITGNPFTVTAGTHRLVVDPHTGIAATGGASVIGGMGVDGGLTVTGHTEVTGDLGVTKGATVAGGLRMDGHAVIQRGEAQIPVDDLGLYSNNPSNWIRLVTNNAPVKVFADGGGGTNPLLTVEPGSGLSLSTPSSLLRLSNPTFTGVANFNNNAEISNDVTMSYGKALMLNGNSSRKPGGPRWVQVWDNLEVAKDLWVFGSANFRPFGEQNWCTLAYYNIHRNGTYWEGTSGPTGPSDLRLKRDVQPVPSALEKIGRLSGVTFRWNETAMQQFTRDIEASVSAGPNATERENQEVRQAERDKRRDGLSTNRVGVVAQEVEAVLPEAVTTDEAGYKCVRYSDLIPLLIEAIKEQSQILARQQREIERLTRALAMAGSRGGADS